MESEKIASLDKFIEDHPLELDGGFRLSGYGDKVSYTMIDDGDEYAKIIVPFADNLKWARSAMDFVRKLMDAFPKISWRSITRLNPSVVRVLLNANYIEVHLYIHVCNPD